MPPTNKESATTERLLGQLVAEIRSFGDRLDRTDDHLRELRAHDRSEIADLRKDVDALKDYMLRVEGGKKMLFAVIGFAAAAGGAVWELLSRLLPFLHTK